MASHLTFHPSAPGPVLPPVLMPAAPRRGGDGARRDLERIAVQAALAAVQAASHDGRAVAA